MSFDTFGRLNKKTFKSKTEFKLSLKGWYFQQEGAVFIT